MYEAVLIEKYEASNWVAEKSDGQRATGGEKQRAAKSDGHTQRIRDRETNTEDPTQKTTHKGTQAEDQGKSIKDRRSTAEDQRRKTYDTEDQQ